MKNEKKGIIAVNADGEMKEFRSINAAARFIGVQFQTIQVAAYRNGTVKGWKIYPSRSHINQQIDELKAMLKELYGE